MSSVSVVFRTNGDVELEYGYVFETENYFKYERVARNSQATTIFASELPFGVREIIDSLIELETSI